MQLVVVKVLFPTDCNDPDKSIAAAEAAALSLSLVIFLFLSNQFLLVSFSFLFLFSCLLPRLVSCSDARGNPSFRRPHYFPLLSHLQWFSAVLSHFGHWPDPKKQHRSHFSRILVAFSFIYDCSIVVDIVATVVAITLACPLLTFRAHQQRILLANVEIRRDSVVF